jgi:ankyrin repeat protein
MKHCQHCDKDFATPSSLKRHIIAKHTENTSALDRHDHRCSRCNAGFARNETLQRHYHSKHTLELMIRCPFCLENYRIDYYERQHRWRCARKYWAKLCKSAKLSNRNQNAQSDGVVVRPATRRDVFADDAQPFLATDDSLRIVHEINVDTRLTYEAFGLVFLHCWNTGDIDSCLEAITASFRYRVPMEPHDYGLAANDPFFILYLLALRVGSFVGGERSISDLNDEVYTFVDLACNAGAADLIEPLIWRGAVFGNQSLLYAVQSGSFDTVRFCLALGADPNDYPLDWEHEDSPLLLASTKSETSHIACLLIENGADVFVSDHNGNTPLHLAAQRADTGLLRVLLAKESSSEFLDSTNDEGQRALDAAIGSVHSKMDEDQALEFVSTLLDAGADANGLDYQHSALRWAIQYGREAILRLLLDREPESPRKAEYLNEALMHAFNEAAEDAFEILIEAGASVDDKMLQYALEIKSSEMVELILKTGARGDSVGHDTLKLLFRAARDQQKHGVEGWIILWIDAMVKCKLLCLYSPDDQLLRGFMDWLQVEVEKFR